MPRRFKVGDRVEGKHAAIRNFAGRIIEVIPMAVANLLKVRWDTGLVETYSSRALQFPALALPLGVINNLPRNALAMPNPANPRQGVHGPNLIVNNVDRGESSEESNYGSR
jgi:hypothetical protein